MIEQAPGVVMELAPDGTIRFISRTVAPFEPEDVAGRPWTDFVPPEEADKHREAIERVLAGEEQVVFETRLVAPPEQAHQPRYLTQLSILRDDSGEIDGVLVWATDQTDRITERERFFRSLEAAPVGVLLVDVEGRIVLANAAVERIFGRARSDLVGRNVDMLVPRRLAGSHAEMRRDYVAQMAPRRMAGRTVAAERADGTRLVLDVALSPIDLSDGGYVLCTITDSTDHERLEAQFRQAQKMEAVGRLAGGIAHDFNNMLTAIVSFNQFAMETLPSDHPARPDLDEVAQAAERSATLTRQLLTFSRKHTARPEVCALNSIVDEIERMLARLLGEDVRIVTHLEKALWPVEIDPGALEQVLMNMAVNARDAMPKGGVLSIETHNVEHAEAVALHGQTTMPAGRYVLLAVSDTGVGMDAATLERVFEPFFTTKGAQGTGLGLATCYGIVAQAGGFLWPYSEPGRGTTFKIYLPRAREGSVRPHPIVSAPPPRPGNEHVLLVEDDQLVRALAARTLEASGYVVTVAADSKAAMVLCADGTHKFDLLLTDVVMPAVGGADLAVFAKARRPGLRVLFMSGFTADALHHSSLVGDDVEVLEKPFAPHELARRVRDLLDR